MNKKELQLLNDEYQQAIKEWEEFTGNKIEDSFIDEDNFDNFEYGRIRSLEMLASMLGYSYAHFNGGIINLIN